MSASWAPSRRGGRAGALVLVPALALLLTACSGAGADPAPAGPASPTAAAATTSAASSSAASSAAAAPAPADPDSDLCASLPREEIDVPMEAYGLPIRSLRSGRTDGSPSCTISTTDPADTIVLLIASMPFAQVEERFTAGAPAENDSVLLGPSTWFPTRSFAAAYGDRTLVVGSEGEGSTPAYLLLMGTALEALPAP